jgi:hypothetical protein
MELFRKKVTDTSLSMQAEQGFYFVGSKYNQLLKQKFQELVGDDKPRPQVVEVIMGRKLEVRQ